jgi:GT2 family glycosyltransferase
MISASIVTYKNNPASLARTIASYLEATDQNPLYVIDNSPTDSARSLCTHPRVEYIFNSVNVGYGSAHNQALKKTIMLSKYHLVLNPDVYFEPHIIKDLISFMEKHPEVGLCMPKVLYPDGRLQPLCKLLPLPHHLITRRFLNGFDKILQRINYEYEMQFSGYEEITDAPFLSGCFMLLRMEALKHVGFFDERFFLYFEDTDLSRRIHERYRTVYFPQTKVYHVHEQEAHKRRKLLLAHIKSGIQYFNKWGWLIDKSRDDANKKILVKYRVNGYSREQMV